MDTACENFLCVMIEASTEAGIIQFIPFLPTRLDYHDSVQKAGHPLSFLAPLLRASRRAARRCCLTASKCARATARSARRACLRLTHSSRPAVVPEHSGAAPAAKPLRRRLQRALASAAGPAGSSMPASPNPASPPAPADGPAEARKAAARRRSVAGEAGQEAAAAGVCQKKTPVSHVRTSAARP